MPRTAVLSALVAAALAVALAGCGTTQPEAGAASAPPVSGAEGCGASPATASGPVSVKDALGRTVKLDRPAERVVVLEWQQIEDVLSLCTTPVAVADTAGYRLWDTAETLPRGVKDVGQRGEPNLDALFATRPDLVIIEASSAEDDVLKQLEKYDVPVLVTIGADGKDPIGQMNDTLALIAEVLGRGDRAKTVTAEFEKALASAKKEIADAGAAGEGFAYFDGYIEGGNVSLRPFGAGSLMGALGEELGLKDAWTGETDPLYGLGQTDIEGMTAVGDATLLRTGTIDPSTEDLLVELQKNPVWASLPAVKEDRVHAFPSGIWTFGGPRSAEQAVRAYVDATTD